MMLKILVNISWDNGLLPDGTKPLPQTNVAGSSAGLSEHIIAKF